MALSIKKIQKTLEILQRNIGDVIDCDFGLTALEVPDYKKSNNPPSGEYLPLSRIEGTDKHLWLHSSFRSPEAKDGFVYRLEIQTGVTGWDATNPQMILYLNGEMAQGFDINHVCCKIEPDTNYDSYCYLYTGTTASSFEVAYKIKRINTAIEALYYDMLIPYEACRDVYPEGSVEYAKVLSILERAANLLDLRDTVNNCAEFLASVNAALAFMKVEFYDALCSTEGKPKVACIGHTHIDVEWLWDRRQTKEKIQRSASTVVNLMKEYPDYKFMLSQPELYRYLKEEAPEKYEEVKALVKDGRWEPEGALYLECDCNLTSGESLVRQLLYGKKFFRDEFGCESRVCFLPDVFGYSAAMPQILKKADIDCFITSKISWNDTNLMPYDAFMWQGIDGSEIFSSFITGQPYKKGEAPARYTSYVGDITPAYIKGTWERFQQKEYSDRATNTYGFGDGGGGPTREMLERAKRLAKGLPALPVLEMTHLYPHLSKMKEQFEENCKLLRRTPKWVGELYLEFHRGTYTSMAENKRGNRKSELGLARCEALSATDLYLGGEYDKKKYDSVWLEVLHDQFHDILPGSSIDTVYHFSHDDYVRILGFIDDESKHKLSDIAKKLDTDGGILVYNPLGYDRAGEINAGGVTLTTGEAIPAFGYAVIKGVEPKCGVTVDGRVAENAYYKIVLDDAGRITSLFDKRGSKECVKPGCLMNEYMVYEDDPLEYEAWELDEYYTVKGVTLDTPAEITPVFDGERAGFRIKRAYSKSTIEEIIWLHTENPRIDLEHNIDWQNKRQLLKLHFPINVHATSASYDVQFGHVSRPTHKNTGWDAAKFEVCAHKWADISEHGYGVAIINDCKYGHAADGSTISITCLKCPAAPNPEADLGKHEFVVSVLPHSGDLCNGGVIREAYNLNQPLICLPIEKQNGTNPSRFSLVGTDNEAVIIEGIKKAEDSDDIIVRLYESFGGGTTANIRVADGFSSAYITNLMERDVCEVEIKDGEITIDLHAFEIVTLRLKK